MLDTAGGWNWLAGLAGPAPAPASLPNTLIILCWIELDKNHYDKRGVRSMFDHQKLVEKHRWRQSYRYVRRYGQKD